MHRDGNLSWEKVRTREATWSALAALIVGMVVAVVLVMAAAEPASSATSAKLRVYPNEVQGGQTVTTKGYGFPPKAKGVITFGGKKVSFITSGRGEFTRRWAAPAGPVSGRVVARTSSRRASAPLTVRPPAPITTPPPSPVPSPSPTNMPPEIFGPEPANLSETPDTTPTVRIRARDAEWERGITEPRYELNQSHMQLYVDGTRMQQFTYDAGQDLLSYTPESPLTAGGHSVEVIATDNDGATNRYGWRFTVVPPPSPTNQFVTGVSEGYRDYSGVDRFYGELGGSDGYSGEQLAHEFVDHNYGWETIAAGVHAPAYAGDPTWINWVAKDDPNRRLIVSLPLLPTKDCPRYDPNVPATTAGCADFINDPDKFVKLARGDYDRYFESFAQGLDTGPDRQPAEDTIVRLGWEFNGEGFPWRVTGSNVEDYKRAWNHVVGVMKAKAPELKFEWTPNVTLDAAGLPFDRMYPDDQNVDYIGLGMYDYHWPSGANDPGFGVRWDWLQNSQNGMKDHRDFATLHRKPMAYTEYGLWSKGYDGGGGNDPQFIRAMAGWFRANPVAYHVYNNPPNDPNDPRHWHNLDTEGYAEAKAEYLKEFSR